MKKISLIISLVVGLTFISWQTQPGLKASMERGKVVYESYCLACHQEDGSGVPGLNPPLAKTDWVTGDKKRLITVILQGLDKEIEINGNVYANPMPAHHFLKDEEVADVLTYIRNSFGNKANLVTPAEVKTLRASLEKK